MKLNNPLIPIQIYRKNEKKDVSEKWNYWDLLSSEVYNQQDLRNCQLIKKKEAQTEAYQILSNLQFFKIKIQKFTRKHENYWYHNPEDKIKIIISTNLDLTQRTRRRHTRFGSMKESRLLNNSWHDNSLFYRSVGYR